MKEPLDTPARIAVAGDWHANTNWAVSCIRSADEDGADVVLHTGDLGYQFHKRFLSELTAALEETGMHLLFVDGNHDDHHLLAALPIGRYGLRAVTDRIWHIPRGFRWTWDGVRFAGVGGAHSVDRTWRLQQGHMWQPEEAITAEQEQAIVGSGPADVLLAHDCPAGVPVPGLQPDRWLAYELAAAEEHRLRLRRITDALQPRILWHGHYHVHHNTTVDLGWGPVHIIGLDMDSTHHGLNMHTVNLEEIQEAVRGGSGDW